MRKGPNKVRIKGMLQPVSDALKLFFKENERPFKSGFFFYVAPMTALGLILLY